jgi:hypothetical protein
VSLCLLLGLEVVPASWLFKDHANPIVYAWNGSCFPLEFDPSWWVANLFLAIWPCVFLPKLSREGVR